MPLLAGVECMISLIEADIWQCLARENTTRSTTQLEPRCVHFSNGLVKGFVNFIDLQSSFLFVTEHMVCVFLVAIQNN